MKKKGNTVYEDQKSKRAERLNRHMVACPHCGSPVLDHLTQCPHCKEAIEPVGYQPMSDKKIKKIRIITYSIGTVIAIVIIALIITGVIPIKG